MSTQICVFKKMSVRTPQLVCFFTRKFKSAQPSLKLSPFEKWSAKSVIQFVVVIIATLFVVSCQKDELSNPILNSTNSDALAASARSDMPPSVDAGPIGRVVYSSSNSSRSASSNSATLYGRASDNGGPVNVLWTQTGGSSNAIISQPTSDTTNVSGLLPGIYTFVLTATDNNGVSRIDSTFITVLLKMTWTIEGITREALVHFPAENAGPAPVIFAFHGHGGSDLGFAERAFETEWPEAIVVYPQGLSTKSNGDKEGKQSGWQHSVGELNDKTGIKDQDLKFFDVILSTLKSGYNVNSSEVFVHGWSNGGEFVYNVLWTARANDLAALAPAAATVSTTNGKKQLPLIQISGTQDSKVHFSNQQKSVKAVRDLDICSSTGTPWATGPSNMEGTEYGSSINAPVVSLQYDGGHSYPFTVSPYIVQFFKEVAGVK